MSTPFYNIRQQYGIDIQPTWGIRLNQQAIWLYYIIVVTFCFAVSMIHETFKQRMAREEIEYERNKAELALYKAQINPHFLFNTLNTIYGLLITNSEKTEQAFEKFINLTKYLYNNAHRDLIPIDEEINYLSQYIDLQKLRSGIHADIVFSTSIEDSS